MTELVTICHPRFAAQLVMLLLLKTSLYVYAEPALFEASYTASAGGFTASAQRSLSKIEKERFLLENTMEVVVMGATLLEAKESSVFTWQADAIIPYAYRYKQSGLSQSRQQASFDYANNAITSIDDGEVSQLHLINGIMDKLGYQLGLRQAIQKQEPKLLFSVVDGDEIEVYEFRVARSEVLETPVGKLNTVRVERLHEPGSDRETVFWLAKDWDYLLIKLSQTRNNGTASELMLERASVNGTNVVGLP